MSAWDNVIGQRRAKGTLRKAMTQDRVSHAYLFHGPYGSGKRAAAIAFAQAMQCKAGQYEGCGTCSDCTRIPRMLHPDVRVFIPVPKDTDPEEVQKRMKLLGENPYATVDFLRKPLAKSVNKQARYPKEFIVDAIRPVVDFMAFEGSYKIVVLVAAEALGEETGNVFLKLLEEPSPKSIFILVTERPDQILPTILSRCQPVRFDPLPPTEIAQALVEREKIDQNEATVISRLADGSFSTARDILYDEQSRAYRAKLMPLLRAAYGNKVDPIMEIIDHVSGQSREQAKMFLGLLLILVRDLILVRELGPDAPIVNVNDRESLIKFNNKLQTARLEQMVNLVEEAWHLVTRNVRVSMILTALVAGLRASMYGKAALPLLTPLAEQVLADID